MEQDYKPNIYFILVCKDVHQFLVETLSSDGGCYS